MSPTYISHFPLVKLKIRPPLPTFLHMFWAPLIKSQPTTIMEAHHITTQCRQAQIQQSTAHPLNTKTQIPNPQGLDQPQLFQFQKGRTFNFSSQAQNQGQTNDSSNPPTHNQPQIQPTSISTHASILASAPNRNPNKPIKKTFAEIMNGPMPSTIPVKTVSLFEGEPIVLFPLRKSKRWLLCSS